MSTESEHLTAALRVATERLPVITRGIINALHSAKPMTWRRHQLAMSIEQTRALLDELVTRQTALGWRDRGDAA